MDKYTVGAKPTYDNPEDMQLKISEYVNMCIPEFLKDPRTQELIITKGQPIMINPNKPTITGLCMHLGFESRQSFYDYEKKELFSYTIKRARLFIENSYEQDIRNPDIKPTGSIFALKNFGWSDKKEIEHSGAAVSITVTAPKAIEESKDDE
jgi:hypothetical protein